LLLFRQLGKLFSGKLSSHIPGAGCLLQLLVVVQPSSIELSVLLLSRFGVVKVELVLYVDITKPAHLPLQLATVQFEDAVVES
jgi:hypothetical protein